MDIEGSVVGREGGDGKGRGGTRRSEGLGSWSIYYFPVKYARADFSVKWRGCGEKRGGEGRNKGHGQRYA